MTATLYVMIGVSGSGKSTYAKAIGIGANCEVVSTDSIRAELFGSESDQQQGDKVFAIAYNRLLSQLKDNKSVVFDATNVTAKSRRQLKDALKDVWENIEKVAIVVNTPIEVAKERNSNRERVVPNSVIDRQYNALQSAKNNIELMFDRIVKTN